MVIKCPNCEKEIADEETKFCPNCGFQLNNQVFDNSQQVNSVPNKSKKKPIFIVIACVLVVCFVAGVLTYQNKVVKPRNTYNQAMKLIENGEYEKANKMLKTISEYKDVSQIKEQIKYESCGFAAINDIKSHLKNPESFQLYDINFYIGAKKIELGDESIDFNTGDEIVDKDHPCILISYGGQNGFGGITQGHAVCQYYPSINGYQMIGETDDLDADSLDYTDDDYELNFIGVVLSNYYMSSGEEVNNINMKRFKKILKDNCYEDIKEITN